MSGWEKGTHGFGLPQWDVDYLCSALPQLDAFINSAMSHVKERISGPLQKARVGWYVLCIVVVASGWQGNASRGCMLIRRYVHRDILLMCRGWREDVSSSELKIRRSEKTKCDFNDVHEDEEVCRWKGLDRDSCASLPDVVEHQPGIRIFRRNKGLQTRRIHQICSPSSSRRTARCHRARPVRDYADNSNVCTHTDLITTLLQGCLKAPHIDLFVFSGTGDVSPVGGNDKG
jgi:hypothetical protein